MRLLALLATLTIFAAPTQLEARGGSGGHSGGRSSTGSTSYHSVRGYTTKNGVYVPPHRATNPNGTKLDNWSTKGNVNPFTGKAGTVDPYAPKR